MKPYGAKTIVVAAAMFAASALSVSYAKTFQTPSRQYKTIAQALAKAQKGDTVMVEKGIYQEQVFVTSGVALLSRELFGAVLDGGGREKVVIMGSHGAIVGFSITNGTIGIYSNTNGAAIRNCLIHNNNQTGIMIVGHLPRIEDNIIVYNRGSAIQGWDTRSTEATINHNTIAFNSTHGLSFGGNSDIIVENNIISFNEKIGLKVEPTVKIALRKNNFFGNTELVESAPEDNFSLDPLFAVPAKLDFSLQEKSGCLNKGTQNDDLGARIIARN
jgi:hypothetical protein